MVFSFSFLSRFVALKLFFFGETMWMFAFCEPEFLWIKTEQRSLCVGQHDKFSDRSEPGLLFEIKGKIRKCLNGISAVPHTEFAWKPVLVWNVANNHGLRCKRSEASRWHCSKWSQWPFDSLGGSDFSCFTCGFLVDQHPHGFSYPMTHPWDWYSIFTYMKIP